MKQPLHIRIDNKGVCWLVLNRPHRGNALDGDLVQKLLSALALIRADASVRVVVISGQGDVFCSGVDLQWMQQMAQAEFSVNKNDAFELALLLDELANFPVPTLARVNGPAYGGAIGLIAACDIAIASSAARFTFSEVRLGLVPATIAPFVIAAIGPRQARRWFLTGKTLDAPVAQRLGLVHQLVLPDELDDVVMQEIELLQKGGPQAQRQVKQFMSCWLKARPFSREESAQLLADVRASKEGREGLAAFVEKRKPGWLT